jgi:hypothetical protein
LSPHVDRLPLVSSAIINVAQDVDEPWPLEVISHSGKAENVTVSVVVVVVCGLSFFCGLFLEHVFLFGVKMS